MLSTQEFIDLTTHVDPGPVSAILVPLFTMLFKPKEKAI